MLVLGPKDAGDVEEIAVETEGGEEVAGVVSQTGGFGKGGRPDGRGRLRRRAKRGWGKRWVKL
jgi:hypothetical protein